MDDTTPFDFRSSKIDEQSEVQPGNLQVVNALRQMLI
jgi:hypothetical protein